MLDLKQYLFACSGNPKLGQRLLDGTMDKIALNLPCKNRVNKFKLHQTAEIWK